MHTEIKSGNLNFFQITRRNARRENLTNELKLILQVTFKYAVGLRLIEVNWAVAASDIRNLISSTFIAVRNLCITYTNCSKLITDSNQGEIFLSGKFVRSLRRNTICPRINLLESEVGRTNGVSANSLLYLVENGTVEIPL